MNETLPATHASVPAGEPEVIMQTFDWTLAATTIALATLTVGLVLLWRKHGQHNPYAGRDREHDD